MSQPTHTYGPTCHLGQAVTFSGSKGDDDVPPLKAQFFYASFLPIDDPLSAAPTSTGSDSKSIKHSPRPFSAYDNNALEEAWLGLGSGKDKRNPRRKSGSPDKDDQRWLKKRDKSPEHDSTALAEGSRKAQLAPDAKGNSNESKGPLNSKTEEYQKEEEESRLAANTQLSQQTKVSKNSQGRAEGECIVADAQASQQTTNPSEKNQVHTEADCIAANVEPSQHTTSLNKDRAEDGRSATDIQSSQQTRQKASDALKSSSEQSSRQANKKITAADALSPQSSEKETKTSRRSDKEKPSNYAEEESTTQDTQSQQPDVQGNPPNHVCEDLHHVGLDSQAPSCCGDLERNSRTEHSGCIANNDIIPSSEEAGEDKDSKDSWRNKGKSKGKPKTGFGGVEVAQRDGTDDGTGSMLTHSAELSTREHMAFENHEQSTGHRKFGEHLDSKHYGLWPGRQGGESRPKTVEQQTKSHPSSDNGSKKASDKLSKATAVEHNANNPKTNSSRKNVVSERPPQTSDAMHSGTAPVGDTGMTGLPFVKLPSRTSSPPHNNDSRSKLANEDINNRCDSYRKTHERESTETETVLVPCCKARNNRKNQVDVPVGVSRLHLVQLPILQMNPIYWSPVHDISAVTRGTWFYKDTMYPVEPPVANQLELGYRELKPWSQTWNDELNSAVEVGAAGEEKIAHNLWTKDEERKTKLRKGSETHPLSNDPYCAAMCFHGEAAAEGTIDIVDPHKKVSEPKPMVKRYSKSQVIYKDAQNAFILKPNLQPSAYFGRKPLQKIRKGTPVGIHVIRGFDWKVWEKLHPSKKTTATRKAEENAPIAGDTNARKRNVCAACKAQEEREKVTDLIFVIHGIGQKLSESLESFHFTHAINSFRRSINLELGNEAVQRALSKDLGGLMVLPINWRSNVSFDEDRPKKDDKSENGVDFTMKDITPSTIPAVRGFIEKVMLDIPYWMSIHKTKMIQAVITEANRVYRLWCRNNPEFHKEGRVHIIAHSLGSTMALDILSKQPTALPKFDPRSKKVNTKCFDFKTTNLFFCGSPVGFFLYLERGYLIPRKGQSKPGAEHGDEHDKAIVGDAGTYGCLAVDNVYNIIHPEDPIAYQVNATVDTQYAACLKKAQVPSARAGFFESIGNAMRSITPGMSSAGDIPVGEVSKPPGMNRLPSQLEMEVHDFTREEIAEKKFSLLNDNGQIDYFLSSDSGPLSLQYITMLSAHSAYWENHDFIRMIVVEVGRKPGRNNCLPSMRAVKVGNKPLKGS